MAKKTRDWTVGDLVSGVSNFFGSDDSDESVSGYIKKGAKTARNAIITGGASLANDAPAPDSKAGKAIRRAGEVAAAGVITGGASLAPQIIGGDTYMPPLGVKKQPSVKPPKGGKVTKRTTTTVTPTARPTQSAVADVKASGNRPRAVQSWRGGDVPQQVRYDPGTKPNYTKKQRSQAPKGDARHDFSALKGFFK